LKLLHNIGPRYNSNYNTIEEILAYDGPISFDGVYKNVFEHAHRLVGKDITLFVMGNYVGKDNSFDVGQRPETYCTWDEIISLCEILQCKLAWHTWSHENLTLLTDEEIIREITPPFYMKSIAYPYGNVDSRVAKLVEKAGYEEAWSVTQGDGSRFQRKRSYLNW